MRSIYEEVLGSDFQKLHPKVQERFGFDSTAGKACIGRGVMDKVWHGRPYVLPFLWVGTWRNIMFPEQGRDVPFTIENYAYRDSFGRETVTWLRKFEMGSRRRFDAYMVNTEPRGVIVDYLGTHQHLAVDLDFRVDERGGMCLTSGEQRFYEGRLGFKFPMLFSGVAEVCEWFDDSIGKYRISVEVRNRIWGPLFGYSGTFEAEWVETGGVVPASVLPIREEARW